MSGSEIKDHVFKISVGTSVAAIFFIFYAWAWYESRMQKIEINLTAYDQQRSKLEWSIEAMVSKVNSQDVALAEIKKDINQILFEIRNKK